MWHHGKNGFRDEESNLTPSYESLPYEGYDGDEKRKVIWIQMYVTVFISPILTIEKSMVSCLKGIGLQQITE